MFHFYTPCKYRSGTLVENGLSYSKIIFQASIASHKVNSQLIFKKLEKKRNLLQYDIDDTHLVSVFSPRTFHIFFHSP